MLCIRVLALPATHVCPAVTIACNAGFRLGQEPHQLQKCNTPFTTFMIPKNYATRPPLKVSTDSLATDSKAHHNTVLHIFHPS